MPSVSFTDEQGTGGKNGKKDEKCLNVLKHNGIT